MMPNRVKQLLTGYSGGQSVTEMESRVRVGIPKVVELYEEYCRAGAQTGGWEFRRKAIEVAIDVFSGSTNWFILQDNNRLIDEYNYQFLLDTVGYIATGKRKYPPYTWSDLLTNYPENVANFSERKDIANLFKQYSLGVGVTEMIQLWCGHRRGFDDMVFTMHLLFGNVKFRKHK